LPRELQPVAETAPAEEEEDELSEDLDFSMM
jgi:hypothetical protein